MALNPVIEDKINEATKDKPKERALFKKLVEYELMNNYSYKDPYINMVKDTCREVSNEN